MEWPLQRNVFVILFSKGFFWNHSWKLGSHDPFPSFLCILAHSSQCKKISTVLDTDILKRWWCHTRAWDRILWKDESIAKVLIQWGSAVSVVLVKILKWCSTWTTLHHISFWRCQMAFSWRIQWISTKSSYCWIRRSKRTGYFQNYSSLHLAGSPLNFWLEWWS